MKRRKFWKVFFLAATLLTALAIFCFSAQNATASSTLSDGITIHVASVVKPDYASMPPAARQSFLSLLSAIVRKSAHFLEFGLLGFNLFAYLRLRRWDRPRRPTLALAWGLATLYACTDELHQVFVSERGPGLRDVYIDSAGALVGALLAMLVLTLAIRRAHPKGGHPDVGRPPA